MLYAAYLSNRLNEVLKKMKLTLHKGLIKIPLELRVMECYGMDIKHFGLRNDVLTHPDGYASYAVSVRQYRYLQSRLLQCMDHSKPPCGLLMLRTLHPRMRDFHSLASHF